MAAQDASSVLDGMIAADEADDSESESSSVTNVIPTMTSTPEERAQARQGVVNAENDLRNIDTGAAGRQYAGSMVGAQQAYQEASAPLAAQMADLDEQARGIGKELKTLQSDHATKQREYTENVAKTQLMLDDMDRMSKDIAAGSTPHDFWAERGLGARLGAMAFSAIGQVISDIGGQPNHAAEVIDQAITRDLALQKMKMQAGQQAYENRNLLLGRFMEHFDHAERAENAAYLSAMQGIQGRLQALAQASKDPMFKQKILDTVLGLQQKTAAKQAEFTADTVGKNITQKKELLQSAQKLEQLKNKETGISQLRAQTAASREQRLAQKETRDENALQVPGWEFKDGFKGDKTEAKELRTMETDTRRATQSLDQVRQLLQAGGQFTSYPKWSDISAAANRAIVKLKGKGLVNAGANFTKLEEDLIEKGYLGQDGAWKRSLDPTAAKRILQAEQDLWSDVQDAFKERGGKPTKDHDYLGE